MFRIMFVASGTQREMRKHHIVIRGLLVSIIFCTLSVIRGLLVSIIFCTLSVIRGLLVSIIFCTLSVIRGLLVSIIFCMLSHKQHDFRKQEDIDHKMCFDFLYKFA
jgi:uncharacterized membrane protein YGL010W